MKFAVNLPKLPGKSAVRPPSADEQSDAKSPILTLLSDRKRLLRVAALLLVAGSAGQMMQVLKHRSEPPRMAVAEPAAAAIAPAGIVALSGETMPSLDDLQPGQAPLATPDIALSENSPAMTAADDQQVEMAAGDEGSASQGPKTLRAPVADEHMTLAAATPETNLPQPVAEPAALPAAGAETCPVTLDLAVVPGGMIGITLIAPCAPNSRVVLKHEGLAVTGLTTANGALFTSLPAMVVLSKVEAILADGSAAQGTIEVPESVQFRRFGVQWQGDDTFQVNAYENGASFGGEGHIYGVQPGMASDAGGFLQILGDPAAPLPLLAEVYTYPAAAIPVKVEVESAVTEATCGRELIGETVAAQNGRVVVTDLTLAMPDCSAVGDFLVLNNLAEDMTLAAN